VLPLGAVTTRDVWLPAIAKFAHIARLPLFAESPEKYTWELNPVPEPPRVTLES
jgi:hypothetical protein